MLTNPDPGLLVKKDPEPDLGFWWPEMKKNFIFKFFYISILQLSRENVQLLNT
jgi:hypothetical protein